MNSVETFLILKYETLATAFINYMRYPDNFSYSELDYLNKNEAKLRKLVAVDLATEITNALVEVTYE